MDMELNVKIIIKKKYDMCSKNVSPQSLDSHKLLDYLLFRIKDNDERKNVCICKNVF